MDRNKLKKLWRDWESMRRGQPKARQLRSLAEKLGRVKADRGKHPMWVSIEFLDLWPLAIPDHKGADIPVGTKNGILNELEKDLIAWDERISRKERSNGSGAKNGDK